MLTRHLPLVFAAAVVLLCVIGFYQLAGNVRTSVAIARFDDEVTRRITAWRNPALDFLMKVVTYSAGIFGMTVLAFALYLFLRRTGHDPAAGASLFLIIGGVALADLFKRILARIRPDEAMALIRIPASNSFPSGHSMSALCFSIAAVNAVMLMPSVVTPLKALICVVALLYTIAVGVSRVYLGVHYPSDVLAAWLLGIAWAALVLGIYYWYRNYHQQS